MRYIIKETKSALSSIDGIANFYESLRKGGGNEFVQYYYKQIDILCSIPNLGKFGKVDGTRELILQKFPYIVVYRVYDKYVQILSIMHKYCTYPEIQAT